MKLGIALLCDTNFNNFRENKCLVSYKTILSVYCPRQFHSFWVTIYDRTLRFLTQRGQDRTGNFLAVFTLIWFRRYNFTRFFLLFNRKYTVIWNPLHNQPATVKLRNKRPKPTRSGFFRILLDFGLYSVISISSPLRFHEIFFFFYQM